jgi:hypothetical protein
MSPWNSQTAFLSQPPRASAAPADTSATEMSKNRTVRIILFLKGSISGKWVVILFNDEEPNLT